MRERVTACVRVRACACACAGWASKFVSTLRASRIRPNFGVVGGLDENNHLVLTQSFVHRTHQEIFGMHFPRTIKNWHLDDWISTIYGDEAFCPPKNIGHPMFEFYFVLWLMKLLQN